MFNEIIKDNNRLFDELIESGRQLDFNLGQITSKKKAITTHYQFLLDCLWSGLDEELTERVTDFCSQCVYEIDVP